MPLSFPTSASINQLYQSGSSATYRWNGSFWQISAPAQTGLSVLTASYSERVAWVQETPPPTSTGSLWYDVDTGNTYVRYDSAWVPVQSNTVNATTASFATSASYLNGVQPTFLHALNTSGQSIGNNSNVIMTGWTNLTTQNAGEWNPTTGVFTATKAGNYAVTAQLTFAAVSVAAANIEFNVAIYKNSGIITVAYNISQAAANIRRYCGTANAILNLAVGDTITIRAYQNTGANLALSTNTWDNIVTIQELSARITR